jgi:serine/threonine-protein kinase
MAEVFLARQLGVEGFERRVALKRILPHLSDSEEFRVMFLDEARLAAQLSHPNVVHIYDFGKVDDYYFIAMEYVDGLDIGRLIRSAKARPIPFEHIARLFADVCAGLNYAHNVEDAQGRKLDLVHRDITPQNLLVSYDGVVKIVDFGIAKAAWQAGRTRPGVVKGKFAYMSPEQVEGRALDGRSDVFSVGICLYEMITGVPLVRRDDASAAMREIRDGKPLHPERFRPDVPDALAAILRKALATSRDSRYGSPAMMQLDLERYLKSAEKLGTAHQLGQYLKREHPKPPDEDASGSKPALSGGTGTEKQAQGTERQRPPSVERRTGPAAIGALRSSEFDVPDEAVVLPAAGGVDEASTRASTRVRFPRRPLAEDSGDGDYAGPMVVKSNTALVSPIGAARRAIVAAAVAAATVTALSLLALRPWRSQASPQPVIVPVPQLRPVVTPLGRTNAAPTELPAVQLPPATSPEPEPALAPAKAPASAPVPTPSALDILSRPSGAKVTLDGRALAEATPARGAQVDPGRHRVLVEKRGFEPRELTVQLGAGEHRTLDVELHRQAKAATPAKPTGFLTVKTVPWAKVFEGSRLLGTTPMANVPLAEGSHVLRFENPDLPPVERQVNVSAGQEAKLSVELK